jgi:hypothetical protein
MSDETIDIRDKDYGDDNAKTVAQSYRGLRVEWASALSAVIDGSDGAKERAEINEHYRVKLIEHADALMIAVLNPSTSQTSVAVPPELQLTAGELADRIAWIHPKAVVAITENGIIHNLKIDHAGGAIVMLRKLTREEITDALAGGSI